MDGSGAVPGRCDAPPQLRSYPHLDLARRGGGLLARPEDVEVRVRADTVSVATGREGMYATVNVRDTGIGLSAEDRERVFEEFYRVRRARGM